jgi:hypothetical protein
MTRMKTLHQQFLVASLVALVGAGSAAEAEWLTVPVGDAAGATQRLYQVNLSNGTVNELEPRRGGTALRSQRLIQNLYSEIGRPQDEVARRGELILEGLRESSGRTRLLLLLESSTGYVGVLSKLGQGLRVGDLRTIAGRPMQSVAGTDANFSLFQAIDPERRRPVAYLVNGSTGGCMSLEGLAEGSGDVVPRSCGILPRLRLGAGQAPLQGSDGEITAYLTVDGTDGAVYEMRFFEGRAGAVSMRKTAVSLAQVFPRGEGQAAPVAYPLLPLFGDGRSTRAVLAFDPVSRRFAYLSGWQDPTGLSATLLPGGITGWLESSSGADLELVPQISGRGETIGAWLFVRGYESVLYLSGLEDPRQIQVQRVEQLQ